MTAKCVLVDLQSSLSSYTSSSFCMSCWCVINLLSTPPSHSCRSVSVCCYEWDLVSHTETQGFLKHVLTHPCPSLTTQHVCVCVCVSGRLMQPCHQKPSYCWRGFSAPPHCQLNTQACTHTLKTP